MEGWKDKWKVKEGEGRKDGRIIRKEGRTYYKEGKKESRIVRNGGRKGYKKDGL